MYLIIMSWIATICSVSGNLLVVYKRVEGMWIWTIGGFIWVVYAVIKRDYAQLTMFLVYCVLNIWGVIKWGKKGVSVVS